MAEYLAKVGIKVKLDVKPKSIFSPRESASFLYLIGWFDGTYDMGRTYFKLAHTRDKEKGFGELNGSAYSDGEIDKSLEATATMADLWRHARRLWNISTRSPWRTRSVVPLHYQVEDWCRAEGQEHQFHAAPGCLDGLQGNLFQEVA